MVRENRQLAREIKHLAKETSHLVSWSKRDETLARDMRETKHYSEIRQQLVK